MNQPTTPTPRPPATLSASDLHGVVATRDELVALARRRERRSAAREPAQQPARDATEGLLAVPVGA